MTRDLYSGAGGHVDMTSNACLPRCEASSAGVTAGISIALANSRGSLGADFKHQCFLCMSLKYNVFFFVYLFVVVVFFLCVASQKLNLEYASDMPPLK